MIDFEIVPGPADIFYEYKVYTQAGVQVYDDAPNFYSTIPLVTPSLVVDDVTFPPGKYYIEATWLNGTTQPCETVDRIAFEVVAPPPAVALIEGQDVVCPNSTETYRAEPTDGAYYLEWEAIGGAILGNAESNEVNVTWNDPLPLGAEIRVFQRLKAAPNCPSDAFALPVAEPDVPNAMISGFATPCVNSTETYSLNLLGSDYQWSISPAHAGTIISGQGTDEIEIQWFYFAPGTAPATTVQVDAEVCSNTYNYSHGITLSDAPDIQISAVTDICNGATVNFSVTGTPAITSGSYLWDFGNGMTSTQAAPSQNYFVSGTLNNTASFPVSVIVTNPNGCLSLTSSATHQVNVQPLPVANLSSPDRLRYCDSPPPSINTNFIAAQQPGTSIEWFRNGTNLSNSNNWQYTATQDGNYTIQVTDNVTGCVATDQQSIAVVTCTPCSEIGTLTLNASLDAGSCNSISVSGSAPSGAILGNLDFGDGSLASGGFPTTHVYDEPGHYRLTQEWTDANGCARVTSTTVEVRIVPDFTSVLVCDPQRALELTDISSHLPTVTLTAWSYDFDGSNHPGASVSINAPANGSQPITLNVEDATGQQCAVTKTENIPALSVPNFAAQGGLCADSPVDFEDQTPGTILSRVWNFDGSILHDDAMPSVNFPSAGTANVTLDIVDGFGCEISATQTVNVLANTFNPFITSNLGGSPVSICHGDQVILSVAGTAADDGEIWTPAGNSMNLVVGESGSYTLTLVDDDGCMARPEAFRVNVNQLPTPVFSGDLIYCDGETAMLNANVGSGYSYDWLDDNGNAYTSTAAEPYIFEQTFSVLGGPGTNYPVTLRLSDGVCTEDFGAVTIGMKALPPEFPITESQIYSDPCEYLPTQLSVSPPGYIKMVNWSTGQNTNAITVAQAGDYKAIFSTAFGCTSESVIRVEGKPDLTDFPLGCFNKDCKDLNITIPPVNIPGAATYQWEVISTSGANDADYPAGGPGVVMGGIAPAIQITAQDDYRIKLHVDDANGCNYKRRLDLNVQGPCPCANGDLTLETITCNGALGPNGYTIQVSLNYPPAHAMTSWNVSSATGNILSPSPVNLAHGGLLTIDYDHTSLSGKIQLELEYADEGQACLLELEIDDLPVCGCELGNITFTGDCITPITNKSRYNVTADLNIGTIGLYDIILSATDAASNPVSDIKITLTSPGALPVTSSGAPISIAFRLQVDPIVISSGATRLIKILAVDPQNANRFCESELILDFSEPFPGDLFNIVGNEVQHIQALVLPHCQTCKMDEDEASAAEIDAEMVDAPMTSLSVYPNPATDRVTVAWEFDGPATHLKIVDLYGRTVAAKPQLDARGTAEFELESWTNGIYYVSLIREGKVLEVKKLVRMK
ncbi:MAG: PKD domain-containing protein [Bacteroidota bacterium]